MVGQMREGVEARLTRLCVWTAISKERSFMHGWVGVCSYFVEVYHDVALWSTTADHVLQHQGEEQPSLL